MNIYGLNGTNPAGNTQKTANLNLPQNNAQQSIGSMLNGTQQNVTDGLFANIAWEEIVRANQKKATEKIKKQIAEDSRNIQEKRLNLLESAENNNNVSNKNHDTMVNRSGSTFTKEKQELLDKKINELLLECQQRYQ